jgi:dipeptidase E
VEYLKEEAKEIPETIYAIDDDTAIMVNAGKIEIVSEGNWKKFN